MDALNELITTLKKFPGLGLKSARRIAYHLMKQDNSELEHIGTMISDLKKNMKTCRHCGNITDKDPCAICVDPLRDRKTLCVVEDVEALSALEQSGLYNGLYHILGGRVAPIKGDELKENAIDFLIHHVKELSPDEIIVATSPKMEGDLTYYALIDTLKRTSTGKVTRLAYGLPVGGAIEFADKMTLHTAIESRSEI